MLEFILISLAFPSLFAKPQIQTKHVRVAGWSVERRADTFTGWVECTAHKGRMRLGNGELVFDFGRSVNTANAVYRIDGGAARLAQQSAFARAYWHSHEEDAPLENPSAGLLALPAQDVVEAHTIAIRIDTARGAQTFKVAPLKAVLDAENTIGCPATVTIGGR